MSKTPKHSSRARKRRSKKPGRWARLRSFVTPGRAVIAGIASVFTFYVTNVRGAYTDRKARLAEVDSLLTSIKRDTANRARNLQLLQGRQLQDHLEPHAIRALVDLIRTEHQLRESCTLAPATRRAAINAATSGLLSAIRQLQAQATRHPLADRAQDVIMGWFAPKMVAPFNRIVLDSADLRGANLRMLRLDSSSFVDACLVGAHLDSASLDSASFQRAILDSATFVRARGSDVSFRKARLHAADFTGALLPHADFGGADLGCALFGNAALDSASFGDAIAMWTYFGNASLVGATHWKEVRDFTGANLDNPQFPEGLEVREALSRGAVPLGTDLAEWTQSKDRQTRTGGACDPSARHP